MPHLLGAGHLSHWLCIVEPSYKVHETKRAVLSGTDPPSGMQQLRSSVSEKIIAGMLR